MGFHTIAENSPKQFLILNIRYFKINSSTIRMYIQYLNKISFTQVWLLRYFQHLKSVNLTRFYMDNTSKHFLVHISWALMKKGWFYKRCCSLTLHLLIRPIGGGSCKHNTDILSHNKVHMMNRFANSWLFAHLAVMEQH